MAVKRHHFTGVGNIIRFNWPFYVLAVLLVIAFLLARISSEGNLSVLFSVLALVTMFTTLVSLLVSWYIYDLSGIYGLTWLNGISRKGLTVLNIHAGFDEISPLLRERYQAATIHVYDFYDPLKHTEPSIQRARKAYPAFPGTVGIQTAHFPLADQQADVIVVFFAAHEIRDIEERITFFREVARVLKPGGQVFVTEHLRNVPNLLAYNAGAFHFYSRSSWRRVFSESGLIMLQEIPCTPFVTTFILSVNGTAY